jgi:hypothetical protein
MGKTDIKDCFSIAQIAKILGRSEYSIWYHTKHNMKPKPVFRGRNILLTRAQVIHLVKENIRLKKGDPTREELVKKIEEAVAE